MVKAMAERAKRTKKGIVEVVQYALGHRIRVHILIVLNEGIYTAGEIAQIIDRPLNTVSNHLRRMLEDGSIEIAKEQLKGNINQYWYKAVEVQVYPREEFEKLPFEYRQNIAGAICQSGTAEVLAGLESGNLADPRACCFWRWYNLDPEGHDEAEAEYHRFVERIQEIEIESTNRAVETKEETISFLLDLKFFERPRKGNRQPQLMPRKVTLRTWRCG